MQVDIIKIIFLYVLFIMFMPEYITANEFIKTDGKKIVDKKGNEFILKGIGLGGWMLQEGYMLETSSFANTQHDIKAKIEALIGKSNTEEFYNLWLQNHVRKADIDSLKAWGFNSVRLPMHYNLFTLPVEEEPVTGNNTWIEKGFALTDSLLSWCAANNIYLILDMHATPGGQGKDAAISDYDPSKPSLWESDENKLKLIALWCKLAERYKDEEWIGGYDLINEPNWDFENSGNQNGCNCNKNTPLLSIYEDIINAIRQIDTNHIVIIEGNCWGNNYRGMDDMKNLDNNLVVSFHKYWNYNSASAIQGILDIRNNLNLPIWCGETGENSNKWFTDAVKLFHQNGIGWAWWPLKKFSSVSCPAAVVKTNDYQLLLDYWSGNGTKPSENFAKNALLEMAENLKIENCIIHNDVIDALTRQPYSDETIPFKYHEFPGKVYAVDYDLGGFNNGYYDKDVQTLHVSTGGDYSAWNTGWSYRNDGVDIESCTDTETNGYNVGWIDADEWLQYTVYVTESKNYNLEFRIASLSGGGSFHLEINGDYTSEIFEVPKSGGWQTWNSTYINDLPLKEGLNSIKIIIDNSGFNLNYFQTIDNVSIDKSNIEKQLIIYPNPFTDFASLKFSQSHLYSFTLNLYEVSGRLIRNIEYKNEDHILISRDGLPSGLYLLSFTGDINFIKKILIN